MMIADTPSASQASTKYQVRAMKGALISINAINMLEQGPGGGTVIWSGGNDDMLMTAQWRG